MKKKKSSAFPKAFPYLAISTILFALAYLTAAISGTSVSIFASLSASLAYCSVAFSLGMISRKTVGLLPKSWWIRSLIGVVLVFISFVPVAISGFILSLMIQAFGLGEVAALRILIDLINQPVANTTLMDLGLYAAVWSLLLNFGVYFLAYAVKPRKLKSAAEEAELRQASIRLQDEVKQTDTPQAEEATVIKKQAE